MAVNNMANKLDIFGNSTRAFKRAPFTSNPYRRKANKTKQKIYRKIKTLK